MKKLLSVILSVTMLLTISSGLDFSAFALSNGASGDVGYAGNSSKVTYTFNNGTLTISGSGYTKDYDNDDDESDDVSPFYKDTTIKTVVINNGVKDIGDALFEGCSGITSVSIPTSVENIGYEAFEDCTGLTSISIPASVESIGSSSFEGCTALTNVSISSGVENIYSSAFKGCTGLTSISIPATVSYIGEEAFKDCTKLANVSLPKYLNNISWDAFNNSAVSNNASSWYNNALYIDNHLITSVDDTNKVTGAYAIKDGTTVICDSALYGCDKITSVTIPDSVTVIGSSAFEDCLGLTSIAIPENVTSIGSGAFSGCNGLTTVSIPKNVEHIGSDAFNTYYYKEVENGNDIELNSKLATVYLNSRKVDSQSVVYLIDSMPENSTLYAFSSYDLVNYCKVSKINYKEHVHAPAAFGTAIPATFKKSGMTVGYYCPLCGDIISPQTKIEKLGAAKLSKVTAAKNSFKAAWKKVNDVDGYQIQYSLKKNMKSSKTKTVKGANKKGVTVKKLKKGKKYYVRIRAYKTINGKKQYSNWSAKKTVKVK